MTTHTHSDFGTRQTEVIKCCRNFYLCVSKEQINDLVANDADCDLRAMKIYCAECFEETILDDHMQFAHIGDVRVALESQRFASGLHALCRTIRLTNQSSQALESRVKEVIGLEGVPAHKCTDFKMRPKA
jgi:hypothetical protein